MGNENPWYAHYIRDYARDTAYLSLIEEGAYRRLLDHYYDRGEPLPSDPQDLYRICRTQNAEEQLAIDLVIRRFFTLKGGKVKRYHNKRADMELLIQKKLNDLNSLRAKKGAEARWGTHRMLEASPKHSLKDAHTQTHIHTQEKLKHTSASPTSAAHPCLLIWQEEHGQLPAITVMSKGRLSKCKARMQADPERFLAEFREAVRRANGSSFLRGDSGKWKAGFDWFVANEENYRKVLEGQYDSGKSNATQGNGRDLGERGRGALADAIRDVRSHAHTSADKGLFTRIGGTPARTS